VKSSASVALRRPRYIVSLNPMMYSATASCAAGSLCKHSLAPLDVEAELRPIGQIRMGLIDTLGPDHRPVE
jgi:hypothetical protein